MNGMNWREELEWMEERKDMTGRGREGINQTKKEEKGICKRALKRKIGKEEEEKGR